MVGAGHLSSLFSNLLFVHKCKGEIPSGWKLGVHKMTRKDRELAYQQRVIKVRVALRTPSYPFLNYPWTYSEPGQSTFHFMVLLLVRFTCLDSRRLTRAKLQEAESKYKTVELCMSHGHLPITENSRLVMTN